MAFDITAIEGYVNEAKNELIAKMTASNTSARNLTLQTGYKGAAAINIMDTDVVFQDGNSSAWNASGTTTLSQRILTPAPIKVHEGLDPKAINKTYLQHEVKAGSYEDSLPFEQVYSETKAKRIADANEVSIWQGDTASANGNLNKYDGFLKIIDAEADVVEGNTRGATAITKDNVVDLVDDMYAVLAVDALEADDLVLATGFDVARFYIAKHKDLDLRNYDAVAGTFEFTIPGTNVKLFATKGLNGTDRMIMGKASEMIVGVDLENEEEAFEMYWDASDRVVKFVAEFKTGVQIAFPENIVEFTVSA